MAGWLSDSKLHPRYLQTCFFAGLATPRPSSGVITGRKQAFSFISLVNISALVASLPISCSFFPPQPTQPRPSHIGPVSTTHGPIPMPTTFLIHYLSLVSTLYLYDFIVPCLCFINCCCCQCHWLRNIRATERRHEARHLNRRYRCIFSRKPCRCHSR